MSMLWNKRKMRRPAVFKLFFKLERHFMANNVKLMGVGAL